jgi:hypothetical protein
LDSGVFAPKAAATRVGVRIELSQEVPRYTAPSPQVFAALADTYRYDKTPLDARVEQTVDNARSGGREKITFGENGGQWGSRDRLLVSPQPRRPSAPGHAAPAGW